MSRILVTGFQPFHHASSNPSQAVVEQLSRLEITGLHTEILPVTFGGSATRLLARVEEVRPNVVICLGQAEGRTQITPERVAINLDDARIPDNQGAMPIDQRIAEDGPDAYFSTLPVREIVESIAKKGIPAAVSLSAGSFVCNHIFYHLQHHLFTREVKSGFIHLPLMQSQAAEFPGLFTMDLGEMIQAVEIAIEVSRS